jgi:hypothetical protein
MRIKVQNYIEDKKPKNGMLTLMFENEAEVFQLDYIKSLLKRDNVSFHEWHDAFGSGERGINNQNSIKSMNDKLLLHDSETLKHINKVRENLWLVIQELDKRAQIHDASKLAEPERSIMAENTEKLGKTVYGTPEYQKLLEEIKPALDHHYAHNRHHSEHWPNGINDMTLIDMIEMLCDWKAASARNKNGNINKSIEVNAKRYMMTPQLQQIFTNTVRELFKD